MAKVRPDLSSGLDLTDLETNLVSLDDGITAPGTVAGRSIIYVDVADGDLKIKFGDGQVKTIVRGDADVGKQTIWVPAVAMRPTVSNGCAALARMIIVILGGMMPPMVELTAVIAAENAGE